MNETLGLASGHRESLGDRLDARGGIGPGFDHLRIGLSLAILFWHSFGISYGMEWTRSSDAVRTLRPLIATMLPAFFALSGFLVMGSAVRINDLRTFVSFRVLRILPALATEISLSALVLGPLLTVLPLADYFGDPRFIEYFGSLIGRVKFVLPGLFVDAPIPEVVNGALWTVGPEIFCYIVMSAMILTTWYRTARGVLACAVVFAGACLLSDAVMTPQMFEILPTKALVLAFLCGNLLFHERARVRWSPLLALLAFVGALLLIGAASRGGGRWILLVYPAVPLLTYVTAVIGLADLPRLPFFHRGDYSYGVYIFGYPIQQAISHFFPDHRIWWFNFVVALPITLLSAVMSWHWIEKPVLGLRRGLLAGRTPKMPVPPRLWSAHLWTLAVAIALYGLFVAYQSKVFPLREVVEHFTRAGPQPAEPIIRG